MDLHQLFLLSAILCILVTQASTSPENWNNDDDNDDKQDEVYRLLKRFLINKHTTTTPHTPGAIDNLIFRSSSTRSPYERPSIWGQSTRQPWYASSSSPTGACTSTSCEHGGICIPKGQMTYECKCVGPWRGMYCGVSDACYNSPCRNGGTCLNVHDDYWCKCTSDYHGTNCQSRFSKRKMSNSRSYQEFVEQIKRNMAADGNRDAPNDYEDPDVPAYDPRNGIFF